MTITFNIHNVTSDLVKKVMMRKFFQMVFMGNDKKSLHIYTATILGASEAEGDDFISDLENLKPFRMHFEFAIGSNDSNEVVSIKNENLTETEHGFLNEIACIRKVWGQKCKIVSGSQAEIISLLEEITCGDKEHGEYHNTQTANLAKYKLLWTEQQKNDVEDKLLKSLSIAGCFEDVEDNEEPNLRDGIFMRKAYAISVPQRISFPKGIELVNWVRTTIEFKYNFDDTNLNYVIKNACSKNTVLTPDFTWYFSPVVKSFIDNRNCMVEIKRDSSSGASVCVCPIQKQEPRFYLSDKFQNSVDAVPNKLTVNFHHWKEDEKINSRQKYRLATRDVLPDYKAFAEVSEISIFLDTADEHNRGNRQFILGVFISFALAFGIDSARLSEISYCFTPINLVLKEDVCWLIFLMLCSLSLMNKPAKLSENSRGMMYFRKALLMISLAWIVVVYGVLRVPLLQVYFESIKSIVGWSTGIFLIVLCLLHIVYLRFCKVDTKDSLWVDLFGEDIL